MPLCFFVSDIHGRVDRYRKLFKRIEEEKPTALFLGGDLLPSGLFALSGSNEHFHDFLNDFLIIEFQKLKQKLGDNYPRVFLILGNDDGRFEEEEIIKAHNNGLWEYIHGKSVKWSNFSIYGYAFVPPTPFQLKDWEKYDVSRYVDPGCVSPEEGRRSVPVTENRVKYDTIRKDLTQMTANDDLSRAIFLFHAPPYKTNLDRAALDGKTVDYVPLDVHVGSIAIKRFIENRQPLITLHGHIHESARLTGEWKERIGKTYAFSAAHDGKELALVRFDPLKPETASRELV